MTDAVSEQLRIMLAQLSHLAHLRQGLTSLVQMQPSRLAQLILRAELNAIERGLQALIIQLGRDLQRCLQLCLQPRGNIGGNDRAPIGELRHLVHPLLRMIELRVYLRSGI